ncbi:hypothetical protein NDU88_006542 [Pleurodeles waltl]|uniref:Uncharacterized protein n=1 Tax=Pleurodeles waltl TaxID=8319 RepID=A0AAV7X1V0_PLEWA|nr:hypothetical protein NDU88_006542 [Pleurodeles waltl]
MPLGTPGVHSGLRKAPRSFPETGFLTQKHFWPLTAGQRRMQRQGFIRAHTAKEGGKDRRRKTRPGALTTRTTPKRRSIAGC